MIEFVHVFLQSILDATTVYMICSLIATRTVRLTKSSFIWLGWFLLFCIVGRFTFIASESVDFLGVDYENYEILPVNSWFMLIFLFFIVLIINSTIFKKGNIESIYITVFSFVVWIILRLISVMVVGLIFQNMYVNRILTLLLALTLLIVPLDRILKAFYSKNFFMKLLMLHSLFLLIFVLIMTNFNQEQVMKYGWFVFFVLIFIVSLNLWILNEQSRKLVQDNRLTVIEQYMPVIDDLVAEMRGKQHEFNNKLLAISSIVEVEHDIETIREKVTSYTQHSIPKNSIQPLLSVENKVVAGFLYSKMKLADWKKINIKTEISTNFQGFRSNEYDWIEVLGILLDNAIEATLPNETIHVSIGKVEDLLEIRVANPGAYKTNTDFAKMFEKGFTTKSGVANHRGYGLFALQQTTRQQNGQIITKNEERNGINFITFGVLLP